MYLFGIWEALIFPNISVAHWISYFFSWLFLWENERSKKQGEIKTLFLTLVNDKVDLLFFYQNKWINTKLWYPPSLPPPPPSLSFFEEGEKGGLDSRGWLRWNGIKVGYWWVTGRVRRTSCDVGALWRSWTIAQMCFISLFNPVVEIQPISCLVPLPSLFNKKNFFFTFFCFFHFRNAWSCFLKGLIYFFSPFLCKRW